MFIFQVKVIYANSVARMQRSIITDLSCNYVMRYGKRRIPKLDGICAKNEDYVCKLI
jgi:hypothetical protein